MQIQKRTMNWLPKPTLYNEQSYKAAKQRNANKTFLASQSNLANSIGNIMNTNAQEKTNIVSNIALDRMGYNKKTA